MSVECGNPSSLQEGGPTAIWSPVTLFYIQGTVNVRGTSTPRKENSQLARCSGQQRNKILLMELQTHKLRVTLLVCACTLHLREPVLEVHDTHILHVHVFFSLTNNKSNILHRPCLHKCNESLQISKSGWEISMQRARYPNGRKWFLKERCRQPE